MYHDDDLTKNEPAHAGSQHLDHTSSILTKRLSLYAL